MEHPLTGPPEGGTPDEIEPLPANARAFGGTKDIAPARYARKNERSAAQERRPFFEQESIRARILEMIIERGGDRVALHTGNGQPVRTGAEGVSRIGRAGGR